MYIESLCFPNVQRLGGKRFAYRCFLEGVNGMRRYDAELLKEIKSPSTNEIKKELNNEKTTV